MRTILMGLRSVVLGLLAVAGLSGTAGAATLSYTANYASTPTDFTGTSNEVTLSKFNPNLGMLTNVTLSLSDNVSGSVTISPIDGNPVSITGLVVDSQMMVVNPFAASNQFSPTLSVDDGGCDFVDADCYGVQLTATDGNVASVSDAYFTSATTFDFSNVASSSATLGDGSLSDLQGDYTFSSSASGDLSNYTGVGSFNAVLLTATELLGTVDSPGLVTQSTSASASVTVEYTYTPVPEPASFAMFGIGIVALAAAVRRRKGKSAQ